MPSNFEIGNIVSGKVVKIKPFGAIVSLSDNIQGLVHISHVSSNFVQNINEYLAIGDVVTVKVISVDEQTNKITLSIKEANFKDKGYVNAKNRYINNKVNNQNSSIKDNNVFKDSDFSNYSKSKDSTSSLEDKLKEWLKQSNERQSGLNKRKNRK